MVPSSRSRRHRPVVVGLCLVVALLVSAVGVATGGPAGDRAVTRPSTTPCVGAGDQASVTPSDAGTISLDTFVAPGDTYTELTNASAVHSSRAAEVLTPASDGFDRTWEEDEVVAYRDVIVHRIVLNGSTTALLDRVAARTRGSPTANFRALVASDVIGIDYLGATACPPTLAVNASIDRGAIRVVPDRANDTLYLVFDTDRLLFFPPGGGDPTTDTFVKGHHGFSLTLRAGSGLVSENVTVENDYQVEDATMTVVSPHKGLVRVASGPDQAVHGRTILAPGSEITLTLHPYTATTGALSATATVNRSGRFTARFDLSPASEGAIYAVGAPSITSPPVVTGGATLLAVGNASGAIVEASNQTTTGTILYGPALTTTDGGFVVVRNASGGLVGVSEYRNPGATVAQIDLSPPLTENQTVTVTVYRDANGNRAFDDADVPYRVNGTVVRDTAVVRLKRERESSTTVTPTTTPTPTPPPPTASPTTMTATSPTTAPRVASPSTTHTNGNSTTTAATPTPSQPGFGVTITIVALLGAGVLAARRLK